MVTEITTIEQYRETIKHPNVVIDLSATWCGPCKRIAPEFAQLPHKYPNVYFAKFDVDIMETMHVKEIDVPHVVPMFVLLKNGKEIHKITGANIPAVEEAIQKYFH